MKCLLIEGELTALNEFVNAERRNRYIAAKIKSVSVSKLLLYQLRCWKNG